VTHFGFTVFPKVSQDYSTFSKKANSMPLKGLDWNQIFIELRAGMAISYFSTLLAKTK